MFTFEPLLSHHQREFFTCGEVTLDRYLKQYASQHQKKNLGRVYVAVKEGDPRVWGYYTLANGSVEFQSVLQQELTPFGLSSRELTLTVNMNGKGNSKPAKLVLKGSRTVDVEIPFTLKNVPLP